VAWQVPRRGEEGAGEAAEGDRREFFASEPGDLAEFAICGRRNAFDDAGLVDRRDVGGAVVVWVGHLVVRAAEHVE
jgi:hypothetical protein